MSPTISPAPSSRSDRVSLAARVTRSLWNEEARRMLAEIYGWFTEGFDTADLQEAKALLEELTSY